MQVEKLEDEKLDDCVVDLVNLAHHSPCRKPTEHLRPPGRLRSRRGPRRTCRPVLRSPATAPYSRHWSGDSFASTTVRSYSPSGRLSRECAPPEYSRRRRCP